jgi:uncharacterized protein
LPNFSRFWSKVLLPFRGFPPRRVSFPTSFSKLVLSLCFGLALLGVGCSWFKGRKPAPKVDAARIQREVVSAVKSAGGQGVWIKGHSRRSTRIEVVVTSQAFDRSLDAVRDVASREGLQFRVEPARSANGRREVEVRIGSGNQLAASWDFREVGEIRRAAIIIDDLGQDLSATQKLLDLPYPLTFSVLPRLEHSARTAEEAYSSGREVMLHLPMEPEPGAAAIPGPGEIKVGMSASEVAQIVAGDLGSVPHVRGVNNHMGSRATADPALMADVMKVLAGRRLFFVDSRTTAKSSALSEARRMGVPAFYRSVFLDDTESVEYTLGQLRVFRRTIDERGVAIAIGHPHPTTIAALARFLPEFERDDIELVPASELVRLPETARLSPPVPR